MSLFVYHFRFLSPLHIGTTRKDMAQSSKMLHSDALVSAIIQAWDMVGYPHPVLQCKADEMNCPSLGFACSSMFPYVRSESKVHYFFPRPLGLIKPKEYSGHKDIKKIKYLEKELFIELLKGKNIMPGKNEIEGDFWLKDAPSDLLRDAIMSKVTPRNVVSRTQAETEIFYVERLVFQENAGFFCLMEFEDLAIKAKVDAALKVMETEGLGTERHIGNGQFEVFDIMEFNDFNELNTSQQTDYRLNLSLFLPQELENESDLLGAKSVYDIVQRGGWVTNAPNLNYRKNAVYMFREGSIFKQGKTVDGKIVNLRVGGINHPVWRSGVSLFLPIHL